MHSGRCTSEFLHQVQKSFFAKECISVCRCTASAQSSLPGNMAGRRASPSGSRLTHLPWEKMESTQSTSTLPPAKSKSLRCAIILSQGRCFHRQKLYLDVAHVSPFPAIKSVSVCFRCSQRGPTVSKKQIERRWRNAHRKRRKSTSLLTIPLYYQRSVCRSSSVASGCCSYMYPSIWNTYTSKDQ